MKSIGCSAPSRETAPGYPCAALGCGPARAAAQGGARADRSVRSELWFSAGSLWEIAIKRGLGRPDLQVDVRLLKRGLLDNGYRELAIGCEHVVEVDSLPALHKDPFDRVLIAQARVEGITLLTADAVVSRYPGPIRKV